jgi:hypothetical protein
MARQPKLGANSSSDFAALKLGFLMVAEPSQDGKAFGVRLRK